MSSPASPAMMRDLIVERLTGATGDPARVVEAGRACAERVLSALRQPLADAFGPELSLEVADVATARFGDARPDPQGFGAMTVVAAETSPDALLLVAEPDAVAIAVSAGFGADPALALARLDRAPSAIDREMIGTLFDMMAQAFDGSGSRAFRICQPIPRPTVGADLSSVVVRDGPAACIRYELVFGASRGGLVVMIPQRVLLALRGEATAAQAAQPSNWRARFGEEIKRSSVLLSATIPMARMTLGELAALEVGQLIELPPEAATQTRLSARDKMLFTCEFGQLDEHYTVRVRGAFDAGQDLVASLLTT